MINKTFQKIKLMCNKEQKLKAQKGLQFGVKKV